MGRHSRPDIVGILWPGQAGTGTRAPPPSSDGDYKQRGGGGRVCTPPRRGGEIWVGWLGLHIWVENVWIDNGRTRGRSDGGEDRLGGKQATGRLLKPESR